MINPLNKNVLYLLIGFMPLFSLINDRSDLLVEQKDHNHPITIQSYNTAFYQDRVLNCTQSERQIVYSSEYANPIVTTSIPIISGRAVYLKSVNPSGDTIQTGLSTKDISLILDTDAELPGFIVFNKRGRSYCSISMGLLDFPDHLSYRCLTKDRKIITGGYQKSNPIVAHDPVRKLVNDNINKVDLDLVLSDNIVVECYKTSNWLGASYTININVSPLELDYYKDDIIAMLNEGYAKLDNSKQLEASTAEEDDDLADEAEMVDSESVESEKDEVIDMVAVATEIDKIPKTEGAESEEQEELEPIDEKVADAEIEVDKVEDSPIQANVSEPEENRNIGARNVPKLDDIITPEEKAAIQREAEDKLYRLQDCFVMLVNRNFTAQQKQRERETTVQDLFINDRANVGVSSVNSNVIHNYVIGDYLLRLERMISAAYQKVEIVFSEIHKVSNFKRNPDGTWSATVTFSQQFRGFADVDGKQLGYSDVTQKNVTVIIRRVELFTGDSTPEVYWEVLLSDIGVNQTQPF